MKREDNINIYDYEVITRANQFKKTAEILKAAQDVAIPLEMNVCFACELYMKYLINFKQKNKHVISSSDLEKKYRHDLEFMYNNLDEDVKQEIKSKMGHEFENKLKQVKLNFEKTRYEYEHDKMIYSPFFLLDFAKVLSDICNG